MANDLENKLREYVGDWRESNPELYACPENGGHYIGDLESMAYQEGMEDGQNSQAHCQDVADSFSDYLRERLGIGMDYYDYEELRLPIIFTPEKRTWQYFGYTDRLESGNEFDDSHTMTLIVGGANEVWGIDWTASQYGYREFPMVLRLDLGAAAMALDVLVDSLFDGLDLPGNWQRIGWTVGNEVLDF